MKCEKGKKKPMNRQTKQLNNKRKNEGKKKERKKKYLNKSFGYPVRCNY